MTRYVLALDQGTTSSRAMLFDRAGTVFGVAQHELTPQFPRTGWVEQDPMDILTTQLDAAAEALASTRLRPRDVAALGITNQRETTLVWDRATGKPVYNAIVWQDRRTAAHCARLREEGNEEPVRQKTGLLIDPYFSGTKVSWILDNVPGARARAEQGKLAFGTVDSWLIWNLTGGRRHLTDRTNAARTMLYNIVTDEWDEDLLRLFDIPRGLLPEVVWSSENVARVSQSLGLAEIDIAGVAGDQQAALFGQLCTNVGDAKNTYGTGCFLLQNIGDRFALSKNKLITTIACGADRKMRYALEGSVFIGGAVVQWLRDKMQFFDRSPDIAQVAATVEDSGNLILVPAFTGLGAPHWDPHASGLLIGLGRETEIGHIARAALESIAFQVADVKLAMEQDTGTRSASLKADGGAAASDILMQFQADLLGIPVERPAVLETTAQGAAYLAGLAIGFWSGLEEIGSTRRASQLFEPGQAQSRAQQHYLRWQEALRRAKGWNQAMHET